MADQEQTIQLTAELRMSKLRELESYAHERGLTLEDAIVELAFGQLQMRNLGRRLGVEGFDHAPQ